MSPEDFGLTYEDFKVEVVKIAQSNESEFISLVYTKVNGCSVNWEMVSFLPPLSDSLIKEAIFRYINSIKFQRRLKLEKIIKGNE